MSKMIHGQWSWCFEDGWYEHAVIVEFPVNVGMKKDINSYKDWCEENLNYSQLRMNEQFNLAIYFKNEEDATLFKLTFGGKYVYDPLKGET